MLFRKCPKLREKNSDVNVKKKKCRKLAKNISEVNLTYFLFPFSDEGDINN